MTVNPPQPPRTATTAADERISSTMSQIPSLFTYYLNSSLAKLPHLYPKSDHSPSHTNSTLADSPPPNSIATATSTAAAGLISSTKNQILTHLHHTYPQSRDYVLAKANSSVQSLQGGRVEAVWNQIGSGKQSVDRIWGRSVHGLSEASGLSEDTVKSLVAIAFVGCTGVSLWPVELGKMMIAPGTGGGVKMLRSAFEANPKSYFRDLRANKDLVEKAGMNGYAGCLILGCVGLAWVGSGAGERLYTGVGTYLGKTEMVDAKLLLKSRL